MNSYDSLTFMFVQNLTWNKEKKRMCGYVCFLFICFQKKIFWLWLSIKMISSISLYLLGQMSNNCFWFLEKPFFINAPSINIQLKNIRRSNMHRSFFSVTSIERKLISRNILNSNQKKLIRYSKYSYVNFVGNQLCHPVPHLVDSFLMHVRPFLYLLVVVLQNQQHKLNCLENSIPAAWNKFRCIGKKIVILTSYTCVCVRNFVDFWYFRCTKRRNLAPFFTCFTISLSCVHRQTQFTPFKIVFFK